jgi:hypothetical protein
MFWSRNRERLLFTTLEPAFRRPEWAVGQLVDHEGRIHRVTRWAELRPVLLERGGSVRQWEVWGRPVSDRELREELDGAAERLLSEE